MELLAAHSDRAVSLTELSHALNISRATAHAILATLTARGWAVRDERTNRYSWGPAAGALVRSAGSRPFHTVLHTLHAASGYQAFVARRDSGTLTVIDTVGDSLGRSPVRTGFVYPLVAPFGRDFVAWAEVSEQQAWMAQISQPASALQRRLSAVLAEIRRRGVVIERLTDEYVRVYAALRALAVDDGADPISTRLGEAFADLTLVDYLADELEEPRRSHSIATVSAPVRDSDDTVRMSVTAAPFAELTGSALASLSKHVRDAAEQLEATLR
jgi:DNA-binding IclR family transcriptional regulator